MTAKRNPRQNAGRDWLGFLSVPFRGRGTAVHRAGGPLNCLLRALTRVLPDTAMVRLFYLWKHGRFLRLRRPRTFNEKVQWYKLYHRDPLMTTLADKYEVRSYLERRGHGGLLNELYGVYDRAEDVPLDELPERFVLKATHGSGMNLICRDKRALDRDAALAQLRRWLRTDYSAVSREWAYRDIRPRLICEKYLENEEYGELLDYKFYCFSGRPEILFVCTDRYGSGGLRYNAYDLGWNRLQVWKGRPASELRLERPRNLEAMVALAGELCGNFPFVRVDFYSVQGRIIFGEFTFYPDSGAEPFTPDRYNEQLGDLFVLSGEA